MKTITGTITDCEKLPIANVIIQNLNSKIETASDSLGNYSIEARKDDVLLFSKIGLENKSILVEKQQQIFISLKTITPPNGKNIIIRKPIIYLYPTEETEVTLEFNFNGKLLTTFPKYKENWNVIASPNGQLHDTKTKRVYSSLFWDGEIDLPKEHYEYNDGFVVPKEKLTYFFIEKLEHIGLNTNETNEFIQFWLPILEQNKFNFIHFLVNEKCNEISVNTVTPKTETTIRIYMEFYGLDQFKTIKEQQLPKTERKGFTLVEWGGTDVTHKIQNYEL